MSDFTPSDEQNRAVQAFMKWYREPKRPKPFFYLAGYAGTGKTTIARGIADSIKGRVHFAAFTGKAAMVMQSKGCTGACTIHSLIYKPIEDDDGIVTYALNNESIIEGSALVIIDECSMVGTELAEDLLSYGVPILVLGDPAQLPPVASEGYFLKDTPDFMLTEIHRQALDNPIIVLSMAVREHMNLEAGTYGDSLILRNEDFDIRDALKADQVLCGMNKTRMMANDRLRELLGYTDDFPMIGERLVCLKNDRKKGLLNGGLWEVKNIKKRYSNSTNFTVRPLDLEGNPVQVYVHDNFFKGTESTLDWQARKRYSEFTYGYTLTVHKSQGSQWDNLLVFDESDTFREDKYRWLYTAITRAAERLTLVI